MNLLFLDGAVLLRWALHRLTEKTKRKLRTPEHENATRVVNTVDAYRQSGIRHACTIASAAEIVTKIFKGSALPFEGDCQGFQVRKSLARVVAEELRSRTVLLTPTKEHFIEAEQLWFKWCDDNAKESYAQFADYLDSAAILHPPLEHQISVALLAHEHVQYILRKEKSHVQLSIIKLKQM